MKFKRLFTIFMLVCVLCFTACDTTEKSAAEGVNVTQESVTSNEYPNKYQSFKDVASAKYLIPGLKQKFIPQGMDVWEEKNLLLISGYFKSTDDAPSSMIITVDLTTGNFVGKYSLKKPDGSFYTGHAGGLTVTNKRVYVSSDGNLYGINLSKIESSTACDLTFDEVIKTPTRGAFCNYSGGYVWVGDFYHDSPNYQTPTWRHQRSPLGRLFCAWLVGYKLNSDGLIDNNAQLEYNIPDAIISLPSEIQGATFDGDKLVLSRSNGRKNDSHVLVYQNPLDSDSADTITLLDSEVPHWYLENETRLDRIVNMPMSQAIVKRGDKYLLLYESGASAYMNDGGVNPTDRVWEITL